MTVKRPAPAASARPAADWSAFLAPLLVVVATVLAYGPALGGGFIWNDADYVTHPALRSWAGLGRIWTEFGATEQYYPLLHSAFWLQQAFWGDAPLGYHLVTVLAHAGAAVLFGLVLRRLAVPGAWLAAALFALHPVHVESVAWIAEQKNTFSLVLYLLAAWAYLDFDATRRRGAYAGALVFFALSLLTKTMTATLPAALLVVLWWRHGRLEWRKDVRPLLPWFVVGAAAGLLISWVESHYGGAAGDEFTADGLGRVLVAARAFWFYLRSLAWPFDLAFIYPRWTPDAREALQWLPVVGLVGLGAGLWAVRRWHRGPLAVFLFFAGSLFPVLGIVPLYGARYSWVWDHWQYLPDLGPLALAGAGLALCYRSLAPRWRWLAGAGMAALFVGLAALTWQHSRIFHDDETLYRATLRRNPAAWMAHANLGALLAADPVRREAAIEHLEAAVRLKPDAAEIHESLGALLGGRPSSAAAGREHLETALRLDPTRATAHNQLGLLLFRAGELTEAEAAFRRARECDPRLASAAANLGTLLVAGGRATEAVPLLQQALALEPSLVAAHAGLGDAWAALGRPAEAEQSWREALRLEPRAVDLRIRLGELLLTQRQDAAGLGLLHEALALDPAAAEAHFHLGNAMMRAGEGAGGMRALQEAVRLRPDWPAARLALANALARSGDMVAAIVELRATLAIRPDDLRARNNLANALLANGDAAGAVREYETALALQPDNASIRANLEIARAQLRRERMR